MIVHEIILYRVNPVRINRDYVYLRFCIMKDTERNIYVEQFDHIILLIGVPEYEFKAVCFASVLGQNFL